MDTNDTRQRNGADPSRPSRCMAPGCPCQDVRILSHRRARFFAHLAAASGETADRIMTPEPDWMLPPPTDTEVPDR